MRRRLQTLALVAGLGGLAGCATVQPWERGPLSTEPMKLDDCRSHRFERSIETYREGAIGGAGGKSGGGCGCS
ncbi:MAG: DUF4266 domain-containing protein [Thermoanaerobaculia bacterium]|jgi:hypothetical protein|nr:MAG: DUF4266 domain-containing protein [Thermoanaerobaculia bacterium]MBZ0101679.1 DUF4266 domain-containing protein [Thermoanaerobaculia bacterium]